MEGSPALITLAFIASLIPALFWLWFWLREDKAHPEPYRLVAAAFVSGMAIVPLVLPLQKFICDLYNEGLCQPATLHMLLLWVVIEETLKYAAALSVVLWNKAVDEPIDTIVYLIAVALGFAALENALFIFNPLIVGDFIASAQTGFFRFLGPTLLHVVASGTVGAALAFTFYRSQSAKVVAGGIGLFIAIVLHALFNFFIMNANGEKVLLVFFCVWMSVIALFLIFEKIKITYKKRGTPSL